MLDCHDDGLLWCDRSKGERFERRQQHLPAAAWDCLLATAAQLMRVRHLMGSIGELAAAAQLMRDWGRSSRFGLFEVDFS